MEDRKDPPASGRSRLAWLPVPGFLLAILLLSEIGSTGPHESQFVLVALNFVCSTLVSLLIAYLIARSFLVRGTPGLLLLGCGAIFWSLAAVVAAGASGGDPNVMVTIHNCCAWLSGLCHLAGVVLSQRTKRTLAPTALWLPVAYGLAVAGVALVALSTLAGIVPSFFVQGQGGTPLRQMVLISAIAMFALTALLLSLTRPRPASAFVRWYALALGLIAAGLFGVLLQSSAASILGWTGRAAQLLGGIYMLIAAVASVRETQVWQISLETALRGREERLRLALEAARMGTWDWDLGTDRVLWNEEQYRILGYEPGRVAPSYQTWIARVHPEDRSVVESDHGRCMEQCADYTAEYRLLQPDGTVRWVEVRGRFEADAAGRPVRSYGVMTDITARKQSEESLRRSEERYRRLFDTMTEAFALHELVTDEQGRACDYRFLEVNPAFERLTGLKRDDVIGRRVLEVLPGTEPYWIEHYGQVVRTGEAMHLENYTATLGRWYEVLAYRTAANRFAVVFSDITARKQAEESLRRSEENARRRAEELAALMDMTPAAVWVSDDPQCRVISGNRAAQRFYEASADENLSAGPDATEQDFTRRFFQDGRELRPEELPMQKAAAEGIDVRNSELSVLLPSGRTITILGNASPLLDTEGRIRGSIGAFVDITERKRTEEALRESEERFRAIFDQAAIGIVLGDLKGHMLAANPAFTRMLGYDVAEVLHRPFDDFTHPDDLRVERELVRRLLDRRQDQYEIEKRYLHKDGSTVEVRLLGTTIRCGNEDAGFSLALVEDITERKRAAETLRRSEERAQLALQAGRMATWDRVLPDGGTVWNEEHFRMLGYAPGEVVAGFRAWADRVHPDDLGEAAARFERNVREGGEFTSEFRVVRPDGTIRWMEARGRTERDGAGQARRSYGVMVDTTERKQAEKALREMNAWLESKVAERTAELQQRTRQLQKLALELSQAEDRERRRIAVFLHEDLQQQIAGAKFHLSLLNGRTKQDPQQQAVVAKIDETLRGAIEKSRSLSHELSPAVLHQNDLGESLRWLAIQMRARHGLVVHVGGPAEVSVRSDALAVFLFRAAQEILLNVVRHARVAEAVVRVSRRGRFVRLSVSDRGRGFDPHGVRASTGFGLLSIRERSELLGGRLTIRSVEGRGSTLRLLVPDA